MSREVAWQGKYLAAIRDGHWEFAERVGSVTAVVIVAIDHEDRLILIEQHWVPAGRRVLELPAGLVGDEGKEESPAEAARRELEEETGYSPASVELLGDFYASPGMTSERFTLARATGLTRTGEGGGTEAEDIAVHLVPLTELRAFIAAKRAQGLGIDAKLLLFLGWAA